MFPVLSFIFWLLIIELLLSLACVYSFTAHSLTEFRISRLSSLTSLSHYHNKGRAKNLDHYTLRVYI
jgi:hypothetical protein